MLLSAPRLGGGTDGPVEALLPYAGYLYAGGHFSQAGAISGLTTPVARWNLASSPSSTAGWGAMSNNTSGSLKLSNDVTALAATSMPYGGQAGPWIVAGGSIERYNPGGSYRLNSASEDVYGLIVWGQAYGYKFFPGCDVASQLPVLALTFLGSSLYVGGEFDQVGAPPSNAITAQGIAKVTWSWPGTWSTLGASGLNSGGRVNALSPQGSNLYAGGGFSTVAGLTANNIAKWNGSAWSVLGAGLRLHSGGGNVGAISAPPSGLYAGGDFNLAGGKPSQLFARWGTLPSTKLLSNPGFEASADGVHPSRWSIAPAGSYATRSTALVHGGTFALQNKDATGATYSVTQSVAVTAGREYALNGWASIPYSPGASLVLVPEIVWKNGVGTVLRTDPAETYRRPTGGWDQFVAAQLSPTGAVTATVTFAFSSLRDTAYLDDVVFGLA